MNEQDFFVDFWNAAGQWSNDTFGPPYIRGPQGPLDHLKKEILEIEKDPTDIKEHVDAFFLVIDAARRSGHQPHVFMKECWMKLAENQQRKWPDWRKADPNKAIEHKRCVRGLEMGDVDVCDTHKEIWPCKYISEKNYEI